MARVEVLARSRYVEGALERAVRRGVDQYVVLGAGLDSSAWRVEGVTVFEVDRAETQEWKRQQLRAAGIAEPEHVRYVALDFAGAELLERLGGRGFDTGRPAFVSWLGASMYLDSAALERTVRVIGGFASGSELLFDYLLPAGERGTDGDMYVSLVGPATAEWGEPWRTFLSPVEVADLLGRHGFGNVRSVRQADAVPAEVWRRQDSLRPGELSRIAHAEV